jgi:hypothetical protein
MFGKNYGWSLCVAKNTYIKYLIVVFENMVVVTFQSVFYLEMH